MASLMDYFRRGGSRYSRLPTNDATSELPESAAHGQAVPDHRAHSRHERSRRAFKVAALALMLLMAGFLAVTFLRAATSTAQHCDTPERGFQCSPTTSHFWGQYSPYFSVPSEIDASVPEGCELTFAQILSRHGARAPTHSKAVFYAKVIDDIQQTATSYAAGYEFLKTYNYTLGADQLTPLGQQQMVNSGLKFYRRYCSLARKSVPFIRTSGQERVVQSAQNFTQGFHAALLADPKATAPHDFPYDMVVISEAATANNTLHHGLCTAFEDGVYSTIGDSAQATYQAVFAPPITARLNEHLPGANLSDAETVALMDLCPFDTVASSPSASLSLSPFCHLFTAAEWLAYDYYQSLGKWYGFGPGNPLGPTQGAGFANELVARLTRAPVRDATSTNASLDADPRTFPLDRALYADFSHDNDMMGILGALGVYDGVVGKVDNTTRTGPERNSGFAASWAVPFAARVYVEKMRCGGGRGGRGDEEAEEEEMVRVLVNDRVMPLKGCGADERGLCTLSSFVESMAFARGNGRWDLCFA